ncbi:double-strand break repair helicase AddA [Pseudooceanicola marinus]|uniref:double-strand break repair helicase AddA n=1 Tax=Pseudooceanicola marinus TaxID=396013 RepID=UPI001CD7943E|nr:double-strand break repair helicase AddA [Pseudooceanicola marinus]MCA1336034.1 double-strand break repair helicase AddA [Pseudooceanicola marinus]
MKRDPASDRQIRAAEPGRSTWLAANAGSGKTRVLTDRVARLLLGGVSPQNILCLTYTKAAASEMQNRLFQRLGEWAMLDDADLREALQRLGVEDVIDGARLARARTLFASAIETPGGLKIQTIHSFCAALLRRFPLEAGVSPQFQEVDDRNALILRDAVVEEIAESEDAGVLSRAALLTTDENFRGLTGEIAQYRDLFDTEPDGDALDELLDLPPGMTPEAVLDLAFTRADMERLGHLVEALRGGTTKGDETALHKLSVLSEPSLAALSVLEDVFLTGATAKEPFSPSSRFPSAGVKKANAHLMPEIEDWQARVAEARELRVALLARDKAQVLQDFARAFLPRYARAKEARGWLDFDDLILRTRELLTNTVVSQWVLWRLDGGIDHILVDEAQDTSPVQWQVIAALAREFTSGAGARDGVERTIFVVGDKKQSIYSFQGADPSGFDRMRADFGAQLAETGQPLQVLELEYSFRSAGAILGLVDRVFDGREEAGFTTDQRHKAFKDAMPGRVDLWPLVEKPEVEDKEDWWDPVDKPGQNNHHVLLARQIAEEIQRMLHDRVPVPVEVGHTGQYRARPIRPGDIMILVRSRSRVFPHLIAACKALGLPMAGADRLKVAAELAVRDITALLNFLALEQDDLSLAAVLKSPLFGWDEQRLFDLAQGRGRRTLWQVLRQNPETYAAELSLLHDLRDQADFLRPFDLIERLLTRHEGRRKLLGRLGEEAEDGLDALLGQALVYEQTEIPSLTGFLVWMEADELQIKRQADSASDQIRVMTVHGAKGLESPVVILPDSLNSPDQDRAQVLPTLDMPLWKVKATEEPAAMREAREARRARAEEERDRLLYVAMTRAEKWLIVCGAGKIAKDRSDWYARIEDQMAEMGAGEHAFPGGEGLRLENGDWAGLAMDDTPPTPRPRPMLPDWARQVAPPAEGPEQTLSPSVDLGGAKALAGEDGLDEEAAKRRGRQVHLLLEHLPGSDPETWEAMADTLLGEGPDRAEPAELALLLAEARGVLSKPATARFFATEALAEVPVTATLAELDGRRIHGTIDRLIVGEAEIWAVDFKTNVTIPDRPEDTPEGLLRQMGAYAAALTQIYPDHRIRTALLWTRSATLMELPHDLVMAALRRSDPS